MFKNAIASVACFGLILWSSIVCGQDNRIVYPNVSLGPVSQQCDSADFYPYFKDDPPVVLGGSKRCDAQIELRLGNISFKDDWNGEIHFLNAAYLTESLYIDIMDGDGFYLPYDDDDGAYVVNIPPGGSTVYKISSGEFQQGVLVIEATTSRIADLTTSLLVKPRKLDDTASDLIAVQPATAPSYSFRAMVCGTSEGDEPFANLESGITVIPASAVSGSFGATSPMEVTLEVSIDGSQPYEGAIEIGNEQRTVMLREVIDNLPDSFKTGQLSLVASEPVYAAMIGIGSRPGFSSNQFASAPAQSLFSTAPAPPPGPGYLQYRDLMIGFTEHFKIPFIWADFGSGATLNVSIWQAEIGQDLAGFYAVGDLAIRDYGLLDVDGNRIPFRNSIAVVKDALGDYCSEDSNPSCSLGEILSCSEQHRKVKEGWITPALCPPIEFLKIWDDKGTEGKHDGSVFWPKPPPGYRCLGAVAQGSHDEIYDLTKAADTYRCVREDLLTAALHRPEFECGDGKPDCPTSDIWKTSGSGANAWFRAVHIDPGTVSPGEMALAPGTFAATSEHLAKLYHSGSSDFETVPPPMAFRLRIPMHLDSDPAPPPPLLTGYGPPSPFGKDSDASTVTLPWFAVKDPGLDPIMQAIVSPEYTMTRVDHYKLIQWARNSTETAQKVIWQFSWGTYGESVTTLQHEVGIKYGAEGGIDIGAVGFKIKWELSYTFTHTQTDTSGWTEGKTFELPVQIPPGTVVAAYQLESVYTLFRGDEAKTQISVSVPYALDRIIFDQYPAADDSEGKTGDRIILEGLVSWTD